MNHLSILFLYKFTSILRVSIPISILLFKISFAQTGNHEQHSVRDTSFTVFSSYEKEIKKYPFIEIAEFHLSGDILMDS